MIKTIRFMNNSLIKLFEVKFMIVLIYLF